MGPYSRRYTLKMENVELRNVPGYGGVYAVDFFGNIYRCNKNGYTILKPLNRNNVPVIRLSCDGKRKELLVSKVVQMAWLGPVPHGMVRYHKNGDKQDNIVSNIGFITRQELGRKTGAMAKRRPVVKLDASGNIITNYSSARSAAKQNYMSYQTIIDRCNGKIKSPLAPDGFRYQWDE